MTLARSRNSNPFACPYNNRAFPLAVGRKLEIFRSGHAACAAEIAVSTSSAANGACLALP